MATDVKIPAGFRLVSNTPSIPAGYKLVSTPEITPEIKAKLDANNAAYAQKSAELNKEYPFVSFIEEQPKSLAAKITRPIARASLLAAQGISNAGLNPAGYIARAAGVDTEPVKPENWVERGIERSGEYGYDAAGIYAGLKGAQIAAEASSIAPSLGKNILNVLTEGGIPAALATSTGSAMLRGYINPRNEFEGWLTDFAGAGIGGVIKGAFTRSVVPTKGSLKEVLPIDKANAALSKGIRADKTKGIARQINQDAPAVYNSLNDDAAQALDKAIGRKLNIEGALDSQKQRYDNYIGQNADRIVLGENPVPTREQIASYPAESNLNPNNYTRDQAITKLRERAEQLGVDIFNDDLTYKGGRYGANHFVQDKDIPNIRTINNTIQKPDMTYSDTVDGNVREYFVKKYNILKNSFSENELKKSFEKHNIFPEYDGILSKEEQFDLFKKFAEEYSKHLGEYKDGTLYGQKDLPKDFYARLTPAQKEVITDNSFMGLLDYFDKRVSNKDLTELLDFVVTQEGKYFDKFKTDPKYVSNQINKPVKDLSFNRRVFVQEPISGGQNIASPDTVTQAANNVKQNAPTLSQLSEGLSDYQTQVLNDVIQEGADKVTNPKGSLRAVHRALEVLNKRIDNTINENPLRPRAKGDPDVRDLMEVKGRLNQALDFGGIKSYDEGMSKAKALRNAFETGYNFKPSEIKFENLGLKTLRDKKAFLQGYTARLEDNVLSDGGTNLATSIKKGENVLKKVLSKDKFDTLMKDADKIEESFKRLKSLEGQANREVLKETERGGSPYRETFESSGSTKGRLMDMLFGWAGRLGSKRLANAYLNPEIDSIKQFGGLIGALKGAGAADTRQLMIDLLNGAE